MSDNNENSNNQNSNDEPSIIPEDLQEIINKIKSGETVQLDDPNIQHIVNDLQFEIATSIGSTAMGAGFATKVGTVLSTEGAATGTAVATGIGSTFIPVAAAVVGVAAAFGFIGYKIGEGISDLMDQQFQYDLAQEGLTVGGKVPAYFDPNTQTFGLSEDTIRTIGSSMENQGFFIKKMTSKDDLTSDNAITKLLSPHSSAQLSSLLNFIRECLNSHQIIRDRLSSVRVQLETATYAAFDALMEKAKIQQAIPLIYASDFEFFINNNPGVSYNTDSYYFQFKLIGLYFKNDAISNIDNVTLQYENKKYSYWNLEDYYTDPSSITPLFQYAERVLSSDLEIDHILLEILFVTSVLMPKYECTIKVMDDYSSYIVDNTEYFYKQQYETHSGVIRYKYAWSSIQSTVTTLMPELICFNTSLLDTAIQRVGTNIGRYIDGILHEWSGYMHSSFFINFPDTQSYNYTSVTSIARPSILIYGNDEYIYPVSPNAKLPEIPSGAVQTNYPDWEPWEDTPADLPTIFPIALPVDTTVPFNPTQDESQHPTQPDTRDKAEKILTFILPSLPTPLPIVIPEPIPVPTPAPVPPMPDVPIPYPDYQPGDPTNPKKVPDVMPSPNPDDTSYPTPSPLPVPAPVIIPPIPIPIPNPPVPIPPVAVLPPTSLSADRLFTVYNPTVSQLNDLGSWLWSSTIIDQLVRIWTEPLDGIISLHRVYCTPQVSSNSKHIYIGYIDTDVLSKEVTSQYVTIDCGSIQLAEFHGTSIDYSPYSRMQLFLPFIGFVDLQVDEFILGTISVLYHIDVYTGTCLVEVKATRSPDIPTATTLYQFTGNISEQIPLTSSSARGLFNSIISIGAAAEFGGVAGMYGLKSSLTSQKTSFSRSGSLTSNAGALGIKKPYIIVSRTRSYDANFYNTQYGFPSNTYITLANTSGYVKVKSILLQSRATDREKDLIVSQLTEGVII